MPLTPKESVALAAMAELLYDFLPGSGNRKWKNHVTFASVAAKAGVGDNWPGGSKTAAIATLIRRTLENDRGYFQRLILEIVNQGIAYRQKKGNPVRSEEIKSLNGLILEVGFKFPELWDPDLLVSLSYDSGDRAKELFEEAIRREKTQATVRDRRNEELEQLKNQLLELCTMVDRNAAGFELERLLNKLFEAFDLAPRKPFRVLGEQIDGSFELDHEVYLLEAKWVQQPVPESELLVFRGKIEGKSAYTRGLLIALNGMSQDASQAIVRGKQATFFAMSGHDLMVILSGEIPLVDFLRLRRRLLGEEGVFSVPFGELKRGSRAHKTIM